MARPRQVSDEQIRDAMRASVLEHGPAVSLDLVARQLSVTSPALLKRFGSRRQLMLAALRPPDDGPWYQQLASGPSARPLTGQLEEIINQTYALISQTMPCVIALRESGIPPSEIYAKGRTPPLIRGVRAITEWLERAHALGLVANQGLETAATALLGAISTRAMSAHLLKRPWSQRQQAEYAVELSQLFSRALAPASGSIPHTPRSKLQ
jgi:AcrR family transcriptional regulator